MVNIAHEYGFEYEQSYIRTFKREFGITPGDLRKTWQTVKIKPPLHLLDENKLEDSLFFGPDIVMVPQFHFIGSEHQVLNRQNSINRINEIKKRFLENERRQIKNMVNPNIFIGLIRNIKWGEKYSLYTTAVQVEKIEDVPQGLIADTFNTSMCAKFRYIGQLSYFSEFNNYFVYRMYNSIKRYAQNKQLDYMLFKTDTRFLNQKYYQIELFTPVSEKQ
jgi:AraC family transcriptional regulator